MKFTAKLNLTLESYGAREREIETEDSMTVRALLRKLRIPLDEVGLIVVNGNHQQPTYVISDGDEVQLYPEIDGG